MNFRIGYSFFKWSGSKARKTWELRYDYLTGPAQSRHICIIGHKKGGPHPVAPGSILDATEIFSAQDLLRSTA